MLKPILKSIVFTAFLLIQLCLADTLKAAPGQLVGGTMDLGGDVSSDLLIKVPAEISDWILDPMISPARKEIDLSVKARMGWKVSVASDMPDGRMTEYDPLKSQYTQDGRRLESPLKVSAPGYEDHPTPWDATLPEGGTIQEGEETEGVSLKIPVTLEQAVSWKDEPLPDGQAYHAVLKFTISPAD